MSYRRVVRLGIACLLFAPSWAHAQTSQPPPSIAELQIIVRSENGPILRAQVIVGGTTTETDADGRARLADELEPGAYVLAFSPPSPFFRRVELTVELEDGDYHVPLLVSPYGCATYRGS